MGGAREAYLFNTTIAGIEQADVCLVVGANPRLDAPLVNTRLRKTWLNFGLEVGLIGEAVDVTYDYAHLGTSAKDIEALLDQKGGFAALLNKAKRPMIIIGEAAAQDEAVLAACAKLADKFGMIKEGWNGWNILHTAASRVAGLDLGFTPGEGGHDTQAMSSGAVETVVLLGADEIDTDGLKDKFVIYIGTHGDKGAHVADIILPSAAYTEKGGLYTNLEGRVQLGAASVAPKGEAKPDWAIIRALSGHMDKALPYDNLEQLREKLFADNPVFASLDHAPGHDSAASFDLTAIGKTGKLSAAPLGGNITEFYFTNPIARASSVMVECAAQDDTANVKEAAE